MHREAYIIHAIHTLIAIDELEINTPLRNDFISRGGILDDGQRPPEMQTRIDIRYAALTNLYGKPPLTGNDTEHHEGITILSRRIHASRWFSGEKNEITPSRESREQEITQDVRYSVLKQQFDGYHSDLVHYRHNSEQIQ